MQVGFMDLRLILSDPTNGVQIPWITKWSGSSFWDAANQWYFIHTSNGNPDLPVPYIFGRKLTGCCQYITYKDWPLAPQIYREDEAGWMHPTGSFGSSSYDQLRCFFRGGMQDTEIFPPIFLPKDYIWFATTPTALSFLLIFWRKKTTETSLTQWFLKRIR